MAGAHWLIRTEPDEYSIEDLKRDRSTVWSGVRNYQARNNLLAMKRGDLVLIYHSSAEPSGAAGIGKIKRPALPDETQFDKKSEYYDPQAGREKPRWFAPEISFVKQFRTFVALEALRSDPRLRDMLVLKKGMRLSVQPVTAEQFAAVLEAGA